MDWLDLGPTKEFGHILKRHLWHDRRDVLEDRIEGSMCGFILDDDLNPLEKAAICLNEYVELVASLLFVTQQFAKLLDSQFDDIMTIPLDIFELSEFPITRGIIDDFPEKGLVCLTKRFDKKL